MSPVTSSSSTLSGLGDHHLPQSARSPSIPNPNPRSAPSTPSESYLSRNHPLRRSNSVQRQHFADENRSDSVNRCCVSPVRNVKPKSAVKLFKETSRTDTPVPMVGPTPGSRLARHRNWDTAASKLLQANGIGMSVSVSSDQQDDGGSCSSIDGDGESVKSDPCDNISISSNNSSKNGNGGDCLRVSTPISRSMEMPFSAHEHKGLGQSVRGVNDEKLGNSLMLRSSSGSVKVARSLNLPPMPPSLGASKLQGTTMEVKKGFKKGSSQQDDVHRFKMLHNHYLQWRFANAKAEASMIAQKKGSEKQLYSLGMKISELQDSVKSKRAGVGLLRRTKTLSTILACQMPSLDEWSTLEAEYSSSLQELIQGLLDVSSQLPLVGNIRADVEEIKGALSGAFKALEMVTLQLQSFMPQAEQVDGLISDLARVYSGEVSMVEECGDLLSKAHLSQVEECSLRGQLMQLSSELSCSAKGKRNLIW